MPQLFFFPPIGTFTIAEPQNWVALFTFLVTSIIASQLSARARQQTQEATARREETERLYALSRAILLTEANQKAAGQFANEIVQIFNFPSVVLFERSTGEIHHAGPADLPQGLEEKLRQAAVDGTLFRDEQSSTTVTSIHLGGEPIASLAIGGPSLSDSALQAISNLVAIGLEKVRGQEAASQAEAARRSEEFKSTLLDAIAHEFKTPLTSIKAAAGALQLRSTQGAEQQRELISIVNEEAERLARLVTEAVRMARVEAGEIQLDRKLCRIGDLLTAVRENLRPLLEGRTLDIQVGPDLPMPEVDTELTEFAVRQVVDNSLKYSPPNSIVDVRAFADENGIVIAVRDQGAGIPEMDQPHVFEKFYRGSNVKSRLVGTGMGLALARQILRAHGGDIRLDHSSRNGSEMIILLPVAIMEKAG